MVRANAKAITRSRPPAPRATKKELHRLIDELPITEVPAAQRYLLYLRNMGDPVFRSLERAPVDDEPVSDKELAKLKREGALAKVERTGLTSAEVRKELGLEARR